MASEETLSPQRERELVSLAVEMIRYARPSKTSPDRTAVLAQLAQRAADETVAFEYGFLLSVIATHAGLCLDELEARLGVSGDRALDVLQRDIKGWEAWESSS